MFSASYILFLMHLSLARKVSEMIPFCLSSMILWSLLGVCDMGSTEWIIVCLYHRGQVQWRFPASRGLWKCLVELGAGDWRRRRFCPSQGGKLVSKNSPHKLAKRIRKVINNQLFICSNKWIQEPISQCAACRFIVNYWNSLSISCHIF